MFGKLPTESLDGRAVNSIITTQNTIQPILSYIISHCEGDNRPYLEIDILGIKFKALLDSGCNITVIGFKGWEILKGLNFKIRTSSVKACSVANDHKCEVLGYVSLPIRLKDKVLVLDVLVVPQLPHTIVLGVDFWISMDLIPNLKEGCWSFSDTIPQVGSINPITSKDILNSTQDARLETLLNHYFTLQGDRLGCTNLVQHKICVNSEPIKQRAYRVSPIMQSHIDKAVKEMLDEDVIEPSQSAWSSPVILVPKKNGEYRFCVDYRQLNKVTRKDAYPLPFISTILDKLRNAKFISSVDIKSAYWQVPVHPDSREYTAFTIPGRGLYHFKRLPFGLCNAPATFQRLIDRVLGPELEPQVFVYLDDVIIISEDFDSHLKVIEEVFERFRKAGLTVSKSKCFFCRRELHYLGYVVDSRGLHVDPEKVSAIVNLPSPKTTTEVRRIIGTASWYRRFIPDFSTLIAPMTALLSKNHKWNWTDECQKSLQRIKNALVSAPILICPDFSRPFKVQTDASAFGIAGILSQDFEDGEHIICYVSRSLTRQERNYSTVERECLAVLYVVEKLRPYLEGYKFTVITDHHSLIWLHKLKEPQGRLARWAVRLQQFDFDIIHRKGKDHIFPDMLSRSVPEINVVTLHQKTDLWYDKMKARVQESPLKYPQWRVTNGKLYKYVSLKYPDLREQGEFWKEVIPKFERKRWISELHDSMLACHAGVYKTYERLKGRFYWPKMRADVLAYVRKCLVCLQQKPERKLPAGELGRHPEPKVPFQMISVDIFGPLPRSLRGFKYVYVVTDVLTKFSLFFPLRNATGAAITAVTEDHVFLMFGVPQYLICDNGGQFRSDLFQTLCKQYQVNIRYTPYYHAQANPVERVNQVLKTMLSSFIDDNHRKWDELLPKVGCAIRSSVHESTALSPFFANFGHEYHASGKSYDYLQNNDEVQRPIPPNIKSKEFSKIYEDIRKRLDRVHERSRIRYNLRRRPISYQKGDKVFHKNYVLSDATKHFTAKLAPKFVGPFIVHKKLSPVTYLLVDSNNVKKGVWHVKDLKSHPPDSDFVLSDNESNDDQT